MKHLSTVLSVVALVAVIILGVFTFAVNDFTTTDEVAKNYAAKTTLSGYAKTADLKGLAKKSDIPSLKGYAKSNQLPDFDKFAKTADLGDYAKKTDLDQFVTYDSLNATLAGYVKVSPDSGASLDSTLLSEIFKAGDRRYVNMPGYYRNSVIHKVMDHHDSLKNLVTDLEYANEFDAERIADLELIQFNDDDDAEDRVEARVEERLSNSLEIIQ